MFQDAFDALIIPGGAKGAETISTKAAVQLLIRKYIADGKIVAMICAGCVSLS
jgi:protein DJ-1